MWGIGGLTACWSLPAWRVGRCLECKILVTAGVVFEMNDMGELEIVKGYV
jgi:hypothetical protein